MKSQLSFMLSVLLIIAGLSCQDSGKKPEAGIMKARQIAKKIMILDSHLDVPHRLSKNYEDISLRTAKGHFDYPRAVAGGLNVAFFAVFIPASLQEKGGAKEKADQQIDLIFDLQNKWPDKFQVITSAAEARKLNSPDKILLGIGIENGAALEDDVENVKYFFDKGVRYITLTHSKNNRICDSSFEEKKNWQGVSPFGKRVIEKMNDLGIMIDVSHASDQAFWDIISISRAPVIASHSGCRTFIPDFERNLDDRMIQAIAKNGGVIQIPFGSYFLNKEFNRQGEIVRKQVFEYMTEKKLSEGDTASEKYYEKLKSEFPAAAGKLTDLIDQIEYVVKLVGIDYVGLGSDFDGIAALPQGIEDVSSYPHIIQELLTRGYSEKDIRKICGENFLRVWFEVEQLSHEPSSL